MEKKQTFWADAQLSEKLSTIPRSEKSTVIRMALRQYFGITYTNPPVEPTPEKPTLWKKPRKWSMSKG